ncbi:MAG: SRPBCC family protein [Acidimicrobiales bacterium]|nr:SRPBCC family protein [Acidimicrobiales bacterium]
MANDQLPQGVTVTSDSNSISASIEVDAAPGDVFDYIRRPANHSAISGDHTVRDNRFGPELLGAGDKFGMNMKLGVPYRITSTVKEFEQDRRIAWAHFNGHRWRWTVEPLDGNRSRVTETFDLSTARFPPALRMVGFPARHRNNVAKSVANVAAHFGRS